MTTDIATKKKKARTKKKTKKKQPKDAHVLRPGCSLGGIGCEAARIIDWPNAAMQVSRLVSSKAMKLCDGHLKRLRQYVRGAPTPDPVADVVPILKGATTKDQG